MTTEYLGSETVEAEGYLQPRQYRITCKCLRCGKEYHWTAKSVTAKDRPCPREACKEAAYREKWEKEQANIARVIEFREPPGHIGDKPIVKAVDRTAEIVMQDHGMTDLRDNLREGDTMAPKLAPAMQQAADNFFTQNPLRDRGVGSRQAEMIRRRALAGHYRNMATSPTIVGGTTGESPMRHVRTEKF
jgi:hypothetical protein